MKRLLIMTAVVIVSVAALISCGANPQGRTGFSKTKASDQATKTAATVTGLPENSFYVYSTLEAKCSADLTSMGIDLNGILDPAYAARPIKSFSMGLAVNVNLKQAFLSMLFEFEGDDNVYMIELTTSGTPVINNTMMQMLFVDGSQIALTSTSGIAASAINVNIQDSGYPVIFASNTALALVQAPTTVASK